jgi:hypothetical protein
LLFEGISTILTNVRRSTLIVWHMLMDEIRLHQGAELEEHSRVVRLLANARWWQ